MAKTKLVGDYELGKVLGSGSFSKVYLAKNIKTGQTVAIKAVDRKATQDPKLVSREITAMSRLNHPNVVKLYDAFPTEKKIYLVVEYVKRGPLSKFIPGRRLLEDGARFYFINLIFTVKYCHENGVVHRDLKPDNLLLDEDNNIKISDFGLCALLSNGDRNILQKTKCGTRNYMPPEIFTSRDGYEGVNADIWACGVILFVLMTGHFPFVCDNRVEYLREVSKPIECPHWFDKDLKELIPKILEADPIKRISVEEICSSPWFTRGLKIKGKPKNKILRFFMRLICIK